MVDAADLKSASERSVGSSPTARTNARAWARSGSRECLIAVKVAHTARCYVPLSPTPKAGLVAVSTITAKPYETRITRIVRLARANGRPSEPAL